MLSARFQRFPIKLRVGNWRYIIISNKVWLAKWFLRSPQCSRLASHFDIKTISAEYACIDANEFFHHLIRTHTSKIKLQTSKIICYFYWILFKMYFRICYLYCYFISFHQLDGWDSIYFWFWFLVHPST